MYKKIIYIDMKIHKYIVGLKLYKNKDDLEKFRTRKINTLYFASLKATFLLNNSSSDA